MSRLDSAGLASLPVNVLPKEALLRAIVLLASGFAVSVSHDCIMYILYVSGGREGGNNFTFAFFRKNSSTCVFDFFFFAFLEGFWTVFYVYCSIRFR